MLRKAGWVLAMVVSLAHLAAAQTPEPPESIPAPTQPSAILDGPSLSGAAPSVFQSARPGSLFYADADFLLWWVNHGPAPTLLTTAPNNGLTPAGLLGGTLGAPGTQVLFDGHNLDYGAFSGFRAKVGVNLGSDGFWAIEAGGFLLPRQSINYSASGGANGAPLLTIPFQDAATGQQSSLDLNSQDALGNPYLHGGITIHSDLQVYGYEFNMIAHSIRTADRSVDLFFGFRTLDMTENLNINQSFAPAQTGDVTLQTPSVGQGAPTYYNVVANSPVFVSDHFGTRNQFYGGQVGARFSWYLGQLSADLTTKVALGVTHEQATIDGSSSAALAIQPGAVVPTANLTTPGGMFALNNNIGSYNQNQFTVVPEIGLNLKYALTSWLTLQVGYSGMYWSNVARPGAQIDTVLNSKLIPTGGLLNTIPVPPGFNPGAFVPGSEQGRPYFAFHDTAFWAQGVNFGVEIRY